MASPLTTKLAPAPAAVFDPTRGCLRIRVSSAVPDRDDEIVDPTALRLDAYRGNPVVLYGHDQHNRLPVAKCESPEGEFRCWLADGDLWQEWYFADSPEGYSVARLYQQKVLRGASIGFRSDGLEDVPPDEAEALYGVRRRLRRHVGGELLETSAVPVPSCPAALAVAWVDPDAAAGVVARGWIGPDRRALPELVRKGLTVFLPDAASGFPPPPAPSTHNGDSTKGDTMSAAATETPTAPVDKPVEPPVVKAAPEVTATAADTAKPVHVTVNVTNPPPAVTAKVAKPDKTKAVDDVIAEEPVVPDDDETLEEEPGEPHDQVKAGLVAAMNGCVEAYTAGEMSREEMIEKLGMYCDDFEKYSAGDVETKDEEADPDADDEPEDGDEGEKALIDLVRKAIQEEIKPLADTVNGVVDTLDLMTSKR